MAPRLCRDAQNYKCWQVIAPYDAEDSRGLLKAAIRDPDPVVFLENEILYGESFPISEEALSKDYVLPIGKAKVRQLCPSSYGAIVMLCRMQADCFSATLHRCWATDCPRRLHTLTGHARREGRHADSIWEAGWLPLEGSGDA